MNEEVEKIAPLITAIKMVFGGYDYSADAMLAAAIELRKMQVEKLHGQFEHTGFMEFVEQAYEKGVTANEISDLIWNTFLKETEEIDKK